MSSVTPTTFYYTDHDFSTWIYTVANDGHAPQVITISYGTDEIYLQHSTVELFNIGNYYIISSLYILTVNIFVCGCGYGMGVGVM